MTEDAQMTREEEEEIRRKYEEKLKKQTDIMDKAQSVLWQAIHLAKQFPKGSDTESFLSKLADYLKIRNHHSFWDSNYVQINRRANFIDNCVKAIDAAKQQASKLSSLVIDSDIEKNIAYLKQIMVQINNILAETNIKSYKGYVSQNMYNILRAYQNHILKRQLAIEQSTPIPKQLFCIVSNYDEWGDFVNGDNHEAELKRDSSFAP